MIIVTEEYDTNFAITRASISQCQIPFEVNIKKYLYGRRKFGSKGKLIVCYPGDNDTHRFVFLLRGEGESFKR